MTRHLPLQGVHNFRDYGDYPTVRGGRVRRGQLWRSAAHQEATDADLEAIDALNLSVVFDLRTPGERAKWPSRRPAGFSGKVVAGEHDAEDSWIELLRAGDLSGGMVRDFMVDYYRRAPFETRHLDVFSLYFQHLAEADGPSLIHCAAGKDRTGLVAALTHQPLLGVHHDDMIADYLATNDPVRHAARSDVLRTHIETESGRRPTDDVVHAALTVEPAYLDASFAAIRERHGSTDAYLREALGVDAAMREALENRLVA